MQIRADFDSGNIQVIDASDPRGFRLAIRPDLASQHFQWFLFKVEGLAPATEHCFTLVNA
ncbi:M14-type cytosolic carboxypeptidase, partial [Stenotrophomonas maltophilia]|uniref:M14-type cytosolic carboxypeptidase n=1 Tax=Stenotrophomonas maltophilia TaxID=40324 RepID=UPI001954D954